MKIINFKNTILKTVGYLIRPGTKFFFSKVTENYQINIKSKRFVRIKETPVQILIYHRILPEIDPFGIDVTPLKRFESQIKYLSSYFNIISVDELLNNFTNNTVKKNTICITFDDGYLDNYQYAFPVLQKYNVPATIFLATDFMTLDFS